MRRSLCLDCCIRSHPHSPQSPPSHCHSPKSLSKPCSFPGSRIEVKIEEFCSGGQMPLPRPISSGLGKYHRGYFAQDCPPTPRQRLLCLLINPVTSSSSGSSVHCLEETSGLAIIDLKCLRLPLPKPPPDGQAILACSNIQHFLRPEPALAKLCSIVFF